MMYVVSMHISSMLECGMLVLTQKLYQTRSVLLYSGAKFHAFHHLTSILSIICKNVYVEM